MPSGSGGQSSRDDCEEECRRQTTSPPDPEITLRSMANRSTVTQPVGRDVGSACRAKTPPASPARQYRDREYRDVDVSDVEHCRRRSVNVTSHYGGKVQRETSSF